MYLGFEDEVRYVRELVEEEFKRGKNKQVDARQQDSFVEETLSSKGLNLDIYRRRHGCMCKKKKIV